MKIYIIIGNGEKGTTVWEAYVNRDEAIQALARYNDTRTGSSHYWIDTVELLDMGKYFCKREETKIQK